MVRWACPRCCESEQLVVRVKTFAQLFQEKNGNYQTEALGDHEWDGGSFMVCRNCGMVGLVREFDRLEAKEREDVDVG